LPQDLVGAPRAEDLLDEDDRRYLEVQERMLNSVSREQDEVVKQPYWDPALKHNPRNYRKFIQKLNSIGYLEFTLSPSDHAGVFFVWKSDHKKIRMIVDARPANSKFRDPAGVSLSTAETFSKFEVEAVKQWRRFFAIQLVCRALGCERLFPQDQTTTVALKAFLFYAY